MPLTIKELEIRVRVGDDPAQDRRATPGSGSRATSGASASGGEGLDPGQVVEDSVRRVLAALRNLEER